MFTNVYNKSVHNSQKLKTIQMPINLGVEETCGISTVEFRVKKEQNMDFCDNVDAS